MKKEDMLKQIVYSNINYYRRYFATRARHYLEKHQGMDFKESEFICTVLAIVRNGMINDIGRWKT